MGGLGTVEPYGEDLLVNDIFLIRQRASHSDTELDPQALADHMVRTLREGGDLATLRLWWHSHVERPVVWSRTDEETIEALRIDQLVSIVGNKRREFGCRLDLFSPRRFTLDRLPLLPLPGQTPDNELSLRGQILAELREKVILIRRDVPLVPELLLNPSSIQEVPVSFDQQDQPH